MTGSQRNYLVVKAQLALDAEAARCKSGKIWVDEDIAGPDFTLQRRIREDESTSYVGVLEIKAVTQDGKILSEYYELVYLK